MQIPELRQVTIGNTTYIPSHVRSSSIPTPSNSILTTLPPPHSRGPSGRNVATSHVHTVTTRIVVSHSQASPIVSGGHIPISGSSYDPSHGIPHIPTYGASHGISHGTSYGTSHAPSYGPQYGQCYQPYGYGYQQIAYSSNYGFVAPPSQCSPHHNASMQPYMGQTRGGYYGQGHDIYSS